MLHAVNGVKILNVTHNLLFADSRLLQAVFAGMLGKAEAQLQRAIAVLMRGAAWRKQPGARSKERTCR